MNSSKPKRINKFQNERKIEKFGGKK